ncbi:MAG: hypothetical protein V9G15_14790 [Dermatophilaceae bacterium]
MQVTFRDGAGESTERSTGRVHVVVLGQPLPATAIAAIADRVAAHGANIDRIRRLSSYPVTTVELDVSGADVGRLRDELAQVAVAVEVDIAVAPAGLAQNGLAPRRHGCRLDLYPARSHRVARRQVRPGGRGRRGDRARDAG